MEYTVELTLRPERPLTIEDLENVAEVGGAASGNPGGLRLETALTVAADNPPAAVAYAIARIRDRIAGEIIAANAMTTEESDRRLNAPRDRYIAIAEIAAMLGVSKQRVVQLTARDDFPAPVAALKCGKIWRAGDLSTFADGWHRKAGRPPKRDDDEVRAEA